MERTYIDVKFADKDTAKSLKCLWDPDVKKWFFLENNPNKKKIMDTFTVSHTEGSKLKEPVIKVVKKTKDNRIIDDNDNFNKYAFD